MTELKPFTKEDYYGYAGAESLLSGKDPMIASAYGTDIIVSGYDEKAIMVSIYPDGNEDGGYYKVFEKEEDAIKFANDYLVPYLDNEMISFDKVAKRHNFEKA